MENRFVTILEVSQKQAYIFQSNKLMDNVVNSAVIAWVMSPAYFEETVNNKEIFSEDKNVVYSGGGHTVLEFADKDTAYAFTKCITTQIRKDYPGIEVFAKTISYNEQMTPGENLDELTRQLERKKSVRKSAFHQGSFGIEKIDSNTLKPIFANAAEKKLPPQEEKIDKALMPKGYERVFRFGELGGTKYDSNFIAVVHIDGNAMGKRVKNLHDKNKQSDWETFKKQIRSFSENIDVDFKKAYQEMSDYVADNLAKGRLSELSIKENKFPVRRIITAGDDICFVSEGRIGIECAAAFIKALNQKVNQADGEGYAACAGVAIVHQKYPFYKAYELAELLCSNAKKFGASLSADGSGKEVSAIDWHIEFGEIKDTLEEIRADYCDIDGNPMEQRPYLVSAPEATMEKVPTRRYEYFKEKMRAVSEDETSYARGKIKEWRNALKQGQNKAEHYLKFNRMEEAPLFDAIELLDTYIELA